MPAKRSLTCQRCGFVLPIQAQRCPGCGVLVSASRTVNESSALLVPDTMGGDVSARQSSSRALFQGGPARRALDVVLSPLSDTLAEEDLSLPLESPAHHPQGAVRGGKVSAGLPPPGRVYADAAVLLSDTTLSAGPGALLPGSGEHVQSVSETDNLAVIAYPGRRVSRLESLARGFSPRRVWGMALALLVLSVGLFFTAWSHSPAGTIAPDWGLASWRIGLVAILPGLVLLALCLLLWRKQVRAALRRVGLCCGILLVIGSIGLLSVAPLHRLQGWWLEARGQYGLALAAYQQSGDDVATNQNMARIAVEWAEQLSTQHRYEEAVAQLQPMVALYPRDDMLAMRARDDLIRAYLAWGDQARQDQAFSVALMRYQALNQASYCNAACKSQTHHVLAQALLGLARQLTERGQYDQAAATYRQLVRDFHDTPEGQAGQDALTAPQPLRGRLVYRDATPAARFLVVLASQWAFDTTAQVFRLQGQQYRARTDATGRFSLSSVAVGTTYMVAWVDPKGHSGTCKASSNQPLYTVQAQPLRTTDAGVIDIACA